MDIFTRKKRSEIMSKIKSKSGIEVLPRGYRGLYLRKHPKGVFGNPDFGSKRRKIAFFIDGCFWHGHRRHYKSPKTNRGYWRRKVRRNRKRDRAVNRRLRKDGWKVIRVWECEL